jgi:uncharacterized membrane protein
MSEALILLFVLAFWFVAMTIVALVIRAVRGRPSAKAVELEELRARYARAELSSEEYERARRAILERV